MTCSEHREEERNAAYCPFCLANYWEGYAHRLESERDRLREAMKEIALLDYANAATNGAGYKAVTIAHKALQEAGDD